LSRHDEIWRLNQLSADELTRKEPQRLVVLPDVEALHRHLARSIADTVRSKPDAALILASAPAAQYAFLPDIINRKRISLRRARLLFTHEYADAGGSALAAFHPLSLRGGMVGVWDRIDAELRPAEENVVFPDACNLEELPSLVTQAGGVDVCFGVVGIDGQIAFNGPEAGVQGSKCRLVRLNDVAVTMDSIRSQVGGDITNFPRHGFTLGMGECLAARRVRLYCYCDVPGLDWARTVLRLAVFGQAGDDYPATWIREHADWQVITDRNTAEQPRHVL
jgi:glucosamine-6-phosphate deaminase